MIVARPGRRSFLKKGMAAAIGAAAFLLVSPGAGWTEPSVADQAASSGGAPGARIKIDFDRKIGTIDRNIYGNFIEHLGRCIYGGIYDEGSPLSDSDAFRKDVLEAARNMHIPLLRWPDGNFSSGYSWKDGVGQRTRVRAAGTPLGRLKNPIASAPMSSSSTARNSQRSLTSA